MSKVADEDLIERAKAGDRAALEQLLEDNQARIYRFAAKVCGHPEDAKGVLQETMMDVVTGISGFRGASSLSSWLYSIARNRCLKRRRKSKFAPSAMEPIDEQAHLEAVGPTPDEQVAQRQLGDVLERAIAELDVEQREVLMLRDVEGLTGSEVAEVLSISLAAMKSRLHRARAALRACVSAHLAAGPESARSPTCPDIAEMYSRNLEGDIRPIDCERMAQHVDGCSRCRGVCESLKETLAACKSSTTPRVPPEVQHAVRAELQRVLSSHR